jgi:2-methylisocitrate lyase-like PEP mutase family enzyme
MRLSLFESRKFHDGLNATIAERLGFVVSLTSVAIYLGYPASHYIKGERVTGIMYRLCRTLLDI